LSSKTFDPSFFLDQRSFYFSEGGSLLDWNLLAGIINIIIINLVLSGDNAVVIAMATRELPEAHRKKATFWGATLAVVLRILLTFVAAVLLKIPFIQVIGGLLLAWIALKLLYPKEEHCTSQGACDNFRNALLTILWADLLMSLDNVLAVAGAAGGNIYLLVFGITFSIPIVLAGSTLLSRLMEKYPWLTYAGAGVLAWTAGKMIVEDKAVLPYIHSFPAGEIIVPVVLAATVILTGKHVRAAKLPVTDKT